MKDILIRCVRRRDIPQLITLCEEHATYENASYDSAGKQDMLLEHLFHLENGIQCLVMEHHEKLVGYTSFFKQFSTWDAKYYLYMDCLFIKENYRGKALGQVLMNKIKDYAISENCEIQWQTPITNTRAIKFYERLGASYKTKERFTWKIES